MSVRHLTHKCRMALEVRGGVIRITTEGGCLGGWMELLLFLGELLFVTLWLEVLASLEGVGVFGFRPEFLRNMGVWESLMERAKSLCKRGMMEAAAGTVPFESSVSCPQASFSFSSSCCCCCH